MDGACAAGCHAPLDSSRSQPLHARLVRLCKMDHLRIRKALVVIKAHADCLVMRTGTEFDLTVSGKIRFTIGRQSEDVSKRRHCAWLACRKRIAKLRLGCKTQTTASNCFLYGVQICRVIRGEYGHDEPLLICF